MFEDGEVRISVRNLVEFILRNGDIDNRRVGSADADAMQQGSRLHRKIQGRMGAEYHAEMSLRITMPFDDFNITVEGRADGVIDGTVQTIDEIKCMYRDVTMLTEPILLHKAQAMCYGYIYGIQNDLERINIQITYCNIDSEEVKRFKEECSVKMLGKWFEELVESYYLWARYLYDEWKIRQASIQGLTFPFEYRKGQRELVISVYRAMEAGKELYIQAPTGIGKTMSTVFPAVQAVGQGFGDKIFYLTAKTITRTVARESFNILRRSGLKMRTITLTAKDKVCPMEESDCNPIVCQRAKGHFDRINDAVYDVITSEEDISREIIEEYARKHMVCPYELSLDVSNWVDSIICDYNYAFDPVVKLKRYFSDGISGKYLFLVDEAHNLVDRARSMFSAEICREQFNDICEIMEYRSTRVFNGLIRCQKDLTHLKRNCSNYQVLIDADINDFILHMMRLYADMDNYLQENQEFERRKEVLDFYFCVKHFLDIFELVDENYRIYSLFEYDRFMIKLFCVNPSTNLKLCMEKVISTIFFSATLLPIQYYKKLLSGNCEDFAIYVDSPFSQDNRILFAAKNVSSKYTRRNRNEYETISDYIESVYQAKTGNYMVFFPSYKLMEDVFNVMSTRPGNVRYIIQEANMNESEREKFISEFDSIGEDDKSLVAFCVLGGIFSEGIDLVNEKLIGSLIVGTGLPQVCAEREILRAYFDAEGNNGFDYAYRYPGMNKVLQAAGRVIRTADDKGIIGLLDYRFLEPVYSELFPREWVDCKVVDLHNLSKMLADFWDKK